MKKIIILLTVFLFASCTSNFEDNISWEQQNEQKINIVTSIIPLASITNYIWGEFVNVESIVPAWISPHGYDIKTRQMVDIENSDLVINLWLEHIDWFLDKAIEQKTKLSVAEWIELLEVESHNHEHEESEQEEESHNDEESHENDEHNEEENHSIDPHVWTSSENSKVIAQKITQKLTQMNAENSEYFENNLESFNQELEEIKNNFLEEFGEKDVKEFIIFHDAFNYLFEELNIDNQNKIVFQKNVLSSPNSNEMKELIDEIQNHWIDLIFREPQFNDSNLQNLANEYNLDIFILNPLWLETDKNGYINNYKNNLKSLEEIYE